MRKLRLDCDALRVETFAAAPAEDAGAGTVRSHAATLAGPSCPARSARPATTQSVA